MNLISVRTGHKAQIKLHIKAHRTRKLAHDRKYLIKTQNFHCVHFWTR